MKAIDTWKILWTVLCPVRWWFLLGFSSYRGYGFWQHTAGSKLSRKKSSCSAHYLIGVESALLFQCPCRCLLFHCPLHMWPFQQLQLTLLIWHFLHFLCLYFHCHLLLFWTILTPGLQGPLGSLTKGLRGLRSLLVADLRVKNKNDCKTGGIVSKTLKLFNL